MSCTILGETVSFRTFTNVVMPCGRSPGVGHGSNHTHSTLSCAEICFVIADMGLSLRLHTFYRPIF